MTGIFLLLVTGVWLYLITKISLLINNKLPNAWWRGLASVLIFLVLLLLPVVDEIIGGREFRKLCNDNSQIIVNTANTQGRTIWFGGIQEREMTFGAINITQVKRNYVDAKTQEPIYHYFHFEAKGGWLIKILGISEDDYPLTFSGHCQPKDIESIDATLGLIHINRPISSEIK